MNTLATFAFLQIYIIFYHTFINYHTSIALTCVFKVFTTNTPLSLEGLMRKNCINLIRKMFGMH